MDITVASVDLFRRDNGGGKLVVSFVGVIYDFAFVQLFRLSHLLQNAGGVFFEIIIQEIKQKSNRFLDRFSIAIKECAFFRSTHGRILVKISLFENNSLHFVRK